VPSVIDSGDKDPLLSLVQWQHVITSADGLPTNSSLRLVTVLSRLFRAQHGAGSVPRVPAIPTTDPSSHREDYGVHSLRRLREEVESMREELHEAKRKVHTYTVPDMSRGLGCNMCCVPIVRHTGQVRLCCRQLVAFQCRCKE